MSRHRRERVPRHRAQRSAGSPAGRAQVTAAVRASGTTRFGPGDDAPAGQDATETTPLPALTASFDGAVPALDGLAAANDDAVPGRRPPGHSPRRGRMAAGTPAGLAPASGLAAKHPVVARGLLVTPWFAAASGFVIAASLWIYSPHPQLTFPAIAISKVPCTSSGCGSHVDQQGAGQLTIKSGERETQQHRSAAPATTGNSRTSTAASGLTFGYVVGRAAPGSFQLIVRVTGKRPIKDWRLAFALPGDQIRSVFGADWRAKGSDGLIASPSTGYQGQHGPGHYGGPGDGGAPDQFGVRFTVVASGTRVDPADCSFDGASCTFHELPSASQGGR